jgi:hypothetical protein
MASAIKKSIEATFPGVDVFLSSDPEDIGAGDPWVDSISDKLAICEVQIILASPASLARPWVHFEAGAGWKRVRQISLCHSGQKPGELPIPLNLLQAGSVTDPEYLKSAYATIATIADHRLPEVDFQALADELAEIERRYLSSGVAALSTPGIDVGNRFPGPEVRDLSDDRQRLEARFYALILRWNSLRSRGVAGDPQLTVRAVDAVNRFWSDPKSLVTDGDVTDALAVLEASVKDLETQTGVRRPLRTELLLALREQMYEQDATNEIKRFDLNAFAARVGASRETVAKRLRDLLEEGLVEPYIPTMGEGPMQGAVRITSVGVRHLRSLGEAED